MLTKLAIAGVALSFAFFAVAGLLVQKSGFLVVDFYDKVEDDRVFIPFPMIAANAALVFMPAGPKEKFQAQFGSHQEIFQSFSSELQTLPDGPFVEVESPGERVSVVKKGRNLLIDIDSEKEEIHLQIPIDSTVRALLQLTN